MVTNQIQQFRCMAGTRLLKEHFCKRFVFEKKNVFILFNSADGHLIVC